jgi:tetratricopeptide (TPR) repeat protein/transglutaminase-like putative cysteine protease
MLSLLPRTVAQATAAQAATFDKEPFTESVTELKDASAAMPATKEYGAEILYEEGIYRIAADGTLNYTHRLIYRVDTEGTAKGWAEISSEWDPWFENPVELRARVLQADGTFVELDQKTVTDAPVKADDSETFSSRHVRRAPLPGMAVGAIVEESRHIEGKLPYFSGGGLYRFAFQENVPVGRTRLVVEYPSTAPYKELIHELPGISVTRNEANGISRVVYEATNLAAAHESDIELETNTPKSPMVEFSTGRSWGAIATGYAAIADPQTVAEEAKAILPKDLPTARMAKIQAIVKQLHHEVRYTGVEFGAAQLTPQRPSEVIQRHYGDCKDKATLLVAMLRAVGIKANLALLSTGPGQDVVPQLPGINRFDHAIVYVPAASAGENALWIDATAEYFAVGTLPNDDEGRNALIVSPETTALTRTPDARPEDSVLIETRTFKLSELGPSHVEEVSETHGDIDAAYRADYGGPETPKMREEMENYVKNAYLAKTLTKLEHGDAADFDHLFNLTLAADGARRGLTSLIDGAVAIFPSTTANSMPKWFSTKPPDSGKDLSAEAQHEKELAEKSRPADFVFRPYISEQRVRILIPPGFTLRALPPNKTTQLGTASLTESYSDVEPGVVTATFRFNSGPPTLTAEQALALRAALLELHKRDYVGIFFDQSGVKALTAGHIREALEIDRNLIAAAPSDAYHHLHLARALLEVGIGSEAQQEARRATELDPKLSAAFATLGWTLEHNALGERFGKGFDLPGAIAAYVHAIGLDPEDNDARFDLAILYEFDSRGTRYAPDADMAAAIKGYKELIEINKDKGEDTLAQYRENLMYALLYSGQFAELDKMIASLPSTNPHRVMAITSATAQRGAAAGIAEADHGNVESTDRNRNLRSAGTQLANLHLYAAAAELMNAGMEGNDDAASAARQIELYKTLKKASLAPLPATDPASPVQAAFMGMMTGTLTHDQAVSLTSKHAYSSPESMERDVAKGLTGVGFLRRIAERSDMTESVMLDLIAGNTTFTSKGDDEHGWAVLAQVPGTEPDHSYVVKEDGAYRVVAGDKDSLDDNSAVGNEVLWALGHNKPDEAKALLDWKRDLTHRQGTDDAFAGPLLPRFWTIGSSKPGADSPEAMRLAAIALLAGSMDEKPYLAEIAAAREKASGQRQTDLDLLLAVAAMGAEQPVIGMPAVKRLMEQEPDSVLALNLAGQGYALQKDPAGWQEMLAPMLKKKPGDHDLLVAQEQAYALAGDFKTAQLTEQKVLDSGKATANDYNSYAWLGLFHNDFGEDIVKAAQQSAQMNKNSGFAELHTLACIYAAEGKTTEAKQVLQEAMFAGNMPEPTSAVWYALGLIYEQYGAKVAALDAYRRVQAHEFDDHTYIDPVSTYLLAQDRIRELSK